MLTKLKRFRSSVLLLLLSACGMVRGCSPDPLSQQEIDALYAQPPAQRGQPISVYHLGHSLVGRDMPAMLEQLAAAGLGQQGHTYSSQLGWGSSLKNHWTNEINGFDVENNHPRYRDAEESLKNPDLDALVMTEMVEIRDAIKWHDSWDYLSRWAERAVAGNADIRLYLYETWHPIDDPEGWSMRLDRDLPKYWEAEILDKALAQLGGETPIYVIPAGQVFGKFVREIDTRGGVGDINSVEDLFRLNDDGSQDNVHFNDIGAYLVALTHYTVLYQRNPSGLPNELLLADGTAATAPSPETALLMQQIVWDVVTRYPRTGVRRE